MQGPDRKCRSCKDIINLSVVEVEKLQPNRLIEEILKVNQKYEFWPLYGSTDRECEMCTEKRIAIVSCLNCGKDMCNSCHEFHSKISGTQTHVTLEITPENERMIELRKAKHFCKRHEIRVVTVFCVQCDEMKCDDCHDDCFKAKHELVDLTEYASGLRDELGQQIKDSKIVLENCTDLLENLAEKERILSKSKESSLQEVQDVMRDLRAAVDEGGERIQNRIQKKYEEKKTKIDMEKQEIESEKTNTQTLIDYLNVVYQCGSNAHVVMEFESLKQRVDFIDTTKYRGLHDSGEFGVSFVKNVEAVQQFSNLCLGQFEQHISPSEKRRSVLLHLAETPSTNSATVFESVDSQKSHHVENDLETEEGDYEYINNSSDYLAQPTSHLPPNVSQDALRVDWTDEVPLYNTRLPRSSFSRRNSSPDRIERPTSGPPLPPRSAQAEDDQSRSASNYPLQIPFAKYQVHDESGEQSSTSIQTTRPKQFEQCQTSDDGDSSTPRPPQQINPLSVEHQEDESKELPLYKIPKRPLPLPPVQQVSRESPDCGKPSMGLTFIQSNTEREEAEARNISAVRRFLSDSEGNEQTQYADAYWEKVESDQNPYSDAYSLEKPVVQIEYTHHKLVDISEPISGIS